MRVCAPKRETANDVRMDQETSHLPTKRDWCWPFMNHHQSVGGRARERDAVFYDDHCVWIQRHQVELKVQFCTKELMQGQAVGGQVGSVGFICWGDELKKKNEGSNALTFYKQNSPLVNVLRLHFILGRIWKHSTCSDPQLDGIDAVREDRGRQGGRVHGDCECHSGHRLWNTAWFTVPAFNQEPKGEDVTVFTANRQTPHRPAHLSSPERMTSGNDAILEVQGFNDCLNLSQVDFGVANFLEQENKFCFSVLPPHPLPFF